jgi:hypothetical protein
LMEALRGRGLVPGDGSRAGGASGIHPTPFAKARRMGHPRFEVAEGWAARRTYH